MASKTFVDEEMGKPAMVQTQPRRKGIGTRVWLVVSESGESHVEEVEKHSIMRRTGLPARDLRVLDPMLSYPSTILGRERAIVINLEHIMAIITAKEVLMVKSTNPLAVQFVQDLQYRVSCSNGARQQQLGIVRAHLPVASVVDSWRPAANLDCTKRYSRGGKIGFKENDFDHSS